ncbi:protein of unknown function [Methylorubrum extorquens]|uniref:Uncharacterized protein n=1 Tax=Methylorubrum extorquens TaxID=408 RepID=A0A2N9AZD1_METEX|nr:protein of unknown function [Methylorubrum extorquens]
MGQELACRLVGYAPLSELRSPLSEWLFGTQQQPFDFCGCLWDPAISHKLGLWIRTGRIQYEQPQPTRRTIYL